MLNLHPLECTIKDNDHIPDLLLIKYWGIISCKYFGSVSLDIYENPNMNPIENWFIGKINQPRIFVGRLNKEYTDKVNRGGVIPYVDIINRLKFGYFKYKLSGWKIENGKNVPIIE